MFSFCVNDKEYKVKFGYGVLRKTGLLTKISNVDNGDLGALVNTFPEMLAVGLMKYQPDFEFTSEKEKENVLMKTCNLLEDYEDEHEDNPNAGYELYEKLNKELERVGFLSGILNTAKEEMQEQTNQTAEHGKKK